MSSNLAILSVVFGGLTAAAGPASNWQPLAPEELEVRLANQHGRQVNFYADLIAGKITAVNFIFTNCTQVCPMLTAQFRALEKEAAARGIKDAQLVSVSVDPERDTAAALKRFASESQAGWTFLSGSEANVKKLLDTFHLPLQQRDGHTSRFVIVNGISGRWTSIDGFASVSEITKLVEGARQQGGR